MKQTPLQRSTFGLLVLALGTAGFALGSSLVVRPELVVPLTFEAMALTLVTFGLLLTERDYRTRDWLTKVVLGAIGARFVALFVVRYTFPPYFFALDSWGYERAGTALSLHWQGLGPAPQLPGDPWLPTYYHLNGIFHFVLGEPALGTIVINLFAGVWTAILTFKLARETLGLSVAKPAALLTAFFPSLILWSVLNIRDAMAMLAVTVTVLFGVRAFRSPRPDNLLILGGGLLMLTALRDYMGFLVLSGLAVGAVAAIRPGRLASSLVGGTVLVLFLSLVAKQLDLFPTEVLEDPFQSATRMRESLQYGATSAFGVGRETTTLGSSLRYLPIGFSYLLLAPFPWAVESTLQAAAAPETLIWYPVLLVAVIGMKDALLRGGGMSALPIAVLIVTATSYALVEGNFGTAYRHRAQVMPLFFIFAGVGFQVIRPWLDQKRRLARRTIVARAEPPGVLPLPPRRPRAPGRRR